MIRLPPIAPRRSRAFRRLVAGRAAIVLALFLGGFKTGFLAVSGLLTLLAPPSWLLPPRVAGTTPFKRQLLGDIGLIQRLLAAAFALGLGAARAAHRALVSGDTLPGRPGRPALERDTLRLPVAHGTLLTLWAIARAPVIARPFLHGAAGGS